MSPPDNDLPAPSAPDNIPVSLRNFADREAAERFGHLIANTIRTISCYLDLERLDGITVAYDYDAALAELDRGCETSEPLQRTASDEMLGVGMAPAVLRDGVVKGHVVFHAPFVLPLEDDKNEHFGEALYLVAHECAHVEDLKHRDICFPGTILQRRVANQEEALFEPTIGALWEEYAACRASAVFGNKQAAAYEESFVNMLRKARANANEAIRSYRLHGTINRVLEEAGRPLCEPLRLAAYLLGHLDGREMDMTAVPQAKAVLSSSDYGPSIARLGEELRKLWSRRGTWTSSVEFTPLKDIAWDVLARGGLILSTLPEGRLYVDIPFAKETMV